MTRAVKLSRMLKVSHRTQGIVAESRGSYQSLPQSSVWHFAGANLAGARLAPAEKVQQAIIRRRAMTTRNTTIGIASKHEEWTEVCLSKPRRDGKLLGPHGYTGLRRLRSSEHAHILPLLYKMPGDRSYMKGQLQGCGRDDVPLTLYRLRDGFPPNPWVATTGTFAAGTSRPQKSKPGSFSATAASSNSPPNAWSLARHVNRRGTLSAEHPSSRHKRRCKKVPRFQLCSDTGVHTL